VKNRVGDERPTQRGRKKTRTAGERRAKEASLGGKKKAISNETCERTLARKKENREHGRDAVSKILGRKKKKNFRPFENASCVQVVNF